MLNMIYTRSVSMAQKSAQRSASVMKGHLDPHIAAPFPTVKEWHSHSHSSIGRSRCLPSESQNPVKCCRKVWFMNLTVDFAESVGTSNLCTSPTKLDTVLLSISLKRIPKLRSSKAAKR